MSTFRPSSSDEFGADVVLAGNSGSSADFLSSPAKPVCGGGLVGRLGLLLLLSGSGGGPDSSLPMGKVGDGGVSLIKKFQTWHNIAHTFQFYSTAYRLLRSQVCLNSGNTKIYA